MCAAVAAHAGDPLTPAPDFVLLDRAAQARDPELADLRALRARLAKSPGAADAADAYANAAIAIGRSRGDPRYYGYASAAIAPWLALDEPPPAMRLLRATLAQRAHRFDDALADLDVLLKADPLDAQARLARAVIEMVQGRPRDAAADCAQLQNASSRLVAVTCAAQAASLLGDAEKARAALGPVLMLGLSEASDDVRLWALGVAAQLADRRGDAGAASRLFQAAMALELQRPSHHDVALRTACADFLIGRRDFASIRTLLAGDTANDALLLRLTIAERATGAPDFERHRAELASRFELQRARGEALHLRDESRFRLDVADDAPAALALAVQNWQVQREPADALLLLRAARAANDAAAAAPVRAWMDDTHIEDPALHALVAEPEHPA